MRAPTLALLTAGSLLFVAGLAVGQRVNTTRLSKYGGRADISKMEWNLLQAQVDSMQFRFPISDGIGLPEYSFNRETETVTAYALVDAKSLGQLPIEQVRKSLQERSVAAEASVFHYMPEVSPGNFALYFRALEKGEFVTFAEYRNNQLVLH